MENGNPISGVLYRDKDLSWGQTKTEYAVGQPQKRCKIGAPVLRDDTDFKMRNLGTLIFGDAHVRKETQNPARPFRVACRGLGSGQAKLLIFS